MSTSNTRTFNPDFAELLSESFSRIGIRPGTITPEHIDDAVRSANLLFIEMSNRVQHQFEMQEITVDTVAGQATYDLPEGVIEVFKMVQRRDGRDTPMWPMSRSDYLIIPDKTNEGLSIQYLFDRGKIGNEDRTITVWPVPDRSTDQFVLWAVYRPQDVTGLPDNIGVAWEWFDAYAAKLSSRLAEKFAPDREGAMAAKAEVAFNFAKLADRERAPARFRMRGYTRRGRGTYQGGTP